MIATLDGCIREATGKSDLSNILQKNVSQDQPPQNQEQTCMIIDGMAAVQSLGNSAGAKTFGEWCDNFTKFHKDEAKGWKEKRNQERSRK